MEQITTLQAAVDWIIRIGAMVLAYRITEAIKYPLGSEQRRYLSFAIGAALGLAAWGVGLEFGYIATPTGDWHAWVEAAAGVVLTIVLGSQVVHARANLKG